MDELELTSGTISVRVDGLVEEGLVRFIGVSNFPKPMIETCLSIRHVDSLQPEFSMIRLELRDVVDWCGTKGIGVVAYGPLGYGLLTGAIDASTEFHPRDWRSGQRPEMGADRDSYFGDEALRRVRELLDGLRPIADRLGLTLSQLALAWTCSQPPIASAIAGSRNPKHVRENAAAGDVELDETTLEEIDALLPAGPQCAG